MIPFDKKPNKIRSGHIINFVSVDSFDDVGKSTMLIFSAFKATKKTLKAALSKADNVDDLIGTVLTTKSGPVKIHNIFVSKEIDGKQAFAVFAAAKGLREVLKIVSEDPKPKCYISKLDDDVIWKSLQKQIVALEAKFGLAIWLWMT